MILRRLTLRSWRGFRTETTVQFDDRITIISGPNECGKSTLIEAASRALFDRHTTRSEELRAVQPWASSLAPQVAVEFSCGADYRLVKRFLDRPSSELSQRSGGDWRTIAEGDAADRRVLELVGGEFPGRGASRPEHRGVAQALWAHQGDADWPQRWGGDVLTTLQESVDSMLQTGESAAIEARIRREHHALLQKERGQPRKDGPLYRAQEELQEAEAELERIVGRRREMEDRAGRLGEIEAELVAMRARHQEAAVAVQEAEAALAEAVRHREQRLAAQTRVARAEAAWTTLNERVSEIETRLKEASEAETERKQLSQRAAEACARVEQLAAALTSLSGQLAANRQRLARKRQQARAAGTLASLRRLTAEAKEWEAHIDVSRSLRDQLSETVTALSARSPEEQDVTRARALREAVRDGEAAVCAQGLAIRVRAHRDVNIAVGLDNAGAEHSTMRTGEVEQFTAATDAAIDITDAVEVTVTSGSESARTAREALNRNRMALADLLHSFDAASLEELEQAWNSRRHLLTRKGELERRLFELPFGGSEAELNRRLRTACAERDRLSEEARGLDCDQAWLSHEAGVLDDIRRELEREESALARAVSGLEDDAASAGRDVEAARAAVAALDRTIAGCDRTVADRRADIERLSTDGFASNDERKQALAQAALALEQARQAHEALAARAQELEDRPRSAYEQARQGVEKLTDQIRTRELEAAGQRAVLVASGEEDLRAREGDVEARVSMLAERAARLAVDAEAWRLLDELTAWYRRRQARALAVPVKQRIDPWLTRLMGNYGGVELSSELIPTHVRVDELGIDAPIEHLSHGAREQMGFLVRLALGAVLGSRGRQVVVLDDRLSNADPGRIRAACGILEDAADAVQIVLLTCHPDRYESLAATRIDTAGLRMG